MSTSTSQSGVQGLQEEVWHSFSRRILNSIKGQGIRLQYKPLKGSASNCEGMWGLSSLLVTAASNGSPPSSIKPCNWISILNLKLDIEHWINFYLFQHHFPAEPVMRVHIMYQFWCLNLTKFQHYTLLQELYNSAPTKNVSQNHPIVDCLFVYTAGDYCIYFK